MKLSEMQVGWKARITTIVAGEKAYRQRLLALGLLPGTLITLNRIAPLGDPIEINMRGFSLSLRKKEADILQLERVMDA